MLIFAIDHEMVNDDNHQRPEPDVVDNLQRPETDDPPIAVNLKRLKLEHDINHQG